MAAAKKARPKKKGDDAPDKPEGVATIKNSLVFDKAVKKLADEIAALDARAAGVREAKKAKLESFKDEYGIALGPATRAMKDAALEGSQRATNVAHYLRVLRALGGLEGIPITDSAVDRAVAKANAAAEDEASEKAAAREPAAGDGGHESDEPPTIN